MSPFLGRSGPAPEPDRAGQLRDSVPTVTAELNDGPLAGRTMDTEAVEGRPPKTLDIEAVGGTCRYCLADWTQRGGSAAYTFLYRA